jgi:hypothetical protein
VEVRMSLTKLKVMAHALIDDIDAREERDLCQV